MELEIKNANRQQRDRGKRFQAIMLKNGVPAKTIPFGAYGGQTFIDHRDEVKKRNYLARHRVNENWDAINAGSLSRFLLWETPDLKSAAAEYSKRFKIPVKLLV